MAGPLQQSYVIRDAASLDDGYSNAGPDLRARRDVALYLPKTTLVPCKADSLQRDDDVQVYSNSIKKWLDARVLEVFPEACIADGYSVAAGTVKVFSEHGLKWVYAENVATHLRKVEIQVESHSATAGVGGSGSGGCGSSGGEGRSSSDAGSPTAAGLCKTGCGRPVQPGLTRGLKPYDTCCKSCAQSPLRGIHDVNCGGACSMAVPQETDLLSKPKALLNSMLEDQKEMEKRVREVFTKAGNGADRLTTAEVARGLHALIEALGAKIEVSEAYARKVCSHYLSDFQEGQMEFADFQRLCTLVLAERKRLWFPDVLPIFPRDFVKQNHQALEKVYEMGKKLGEGSFGIVHQAVHRLSGEQRVCKRIPKSSSLMSRDQVMKEIGNMAMLDHPNVIKVFEYFDDDQCVSQIMEECGGRELQEKIDIYRKSGIPPYDEIFVQDVMKQTLRALAFMHFRSFMHKDLKPQNIMLVDREGSFVKVIDFGLAELFHPTQQYATFTGGTLLYMAPEVFRQELTTKIDVWSAGVIFYNLLTADFPLVAPWPPPGGINEEGQAWWQDATIQTIKNEEPRLHKRLEQWMFVGKDLLWKTLDKDMNTRPDAATCLQHDWFSDHTFNSEPPALSIGVVQCMEAYARMSELKKAIFMLIACQCKVDALNELRIVFTHFDVFNRGSLSTFVVKSVLTASGMGLLSAERVIHAIDRDADGWITWTEFTAAAICVSVCRSRRCVDTAFAAFDADQDGRIGADDILRVLGSALPTQGQAAWAKLLPQQMAEVLAASPEEPSGLGEAVRSWASKMMASEADAKTTISRLQFHAYLGQRLDFHAGDALYSVDARATKGTETELGATILNVSSGVQIHSISI
mmetsp:Transcript_24140/g.71850  ORF Transcript_24140/g.71850 Transcript_24140/m.71850 type:complete len:861 (+) Transcript_24140:54-2636(+)